LGVISIKRFALYFFMTMLAMLSLCCGCAGVATHDEMAARVNGQVIARQEVDDFKRIIYLYMPDLEEIYGSSQQAALLENEILWLLIETRVLQQELERLSLKPDETALEQHFRDFREDLISLVYETEEKYLDRLQ
jgi:hypothetical protein